MMKMHLTARASNEGARRVARWVAEEFGGDVDRAAEKIWIMGMGLQRIIAGEITPGRDLGVRLHKVCGVTAGMFNRAPSAGWFDDAPHVRAA